MAISSFDRPAGLPPIDFDFLFRTKVYGDEQNEKAAKEFDTLYGEIAKIKAVPQDAELRSQKVKGYNDALKSWTDKYSNNLRAGMPELRQIRSQFNQDFNYGALGDIHKKGTEYEKNYAEWAKNAAEGKYAGLEDVAKFHLVDLPMMTYQGQQELRPGTGVYNSINWGNPKQYIKLNQDLFDKYAQTWAASAGYGELKRDKYGFISREKNKRVDPNEVIEGVMQLAKSDPNIQNQLRDMSEYYQYKADLVQTPYTEYTSEGIPYIVNNNEFGQEVYAKPVTGQDILDDQIHGIATALALREGYSEEDIQSWQPHAPVKGKKEKTPPPIVKSGYTHPTVITPGNEYWKTKKSNLPSTWSEGLEDYLPTTSSFLGLGTPKFTPEQEKDLNRAISWKTGSGTPIGLSALSNKEKVQLLEDYYDFKANQDVSFGVELPGEIDPETGVVRTSVEAANKLATEKNLFYFGNPSDTKGANLHANLSFKDVENPSEVISGSEISSDYKNYKFTWAGQLPKGKNPYFPVGDILIATDESGNKKEFAVMGDVTQNTAYTPYFQMNQALYTGSSEVNIGGDSYIFDYDDVNNYGTLIDKKTNQIIYTSDPETADPVDNVYEKLIKGAPKYSNGFTPNLSFGAGR